MADPAYVTSVVARFRPFDWGQVGPWRFVICHDREVYQSFLKLWVTDFHIEELPPMEAAFVLAAPSADVLFWDTIHG